MNLIIHPDELFLKGANQRLFYDQLINNLKQIFKQIKVERTESGLWVENFEENKLSQFPTAKRKFGIVCSNVNVVKRICVVYILQAASSPIRPAKGLHSIG